MCRLSRELAALEGRAAAVTDFLEQYQLTPEEVRPLAAGRQQPEQEPGQPQD
jgi:hypothetical protein